MINKNQPINNSISLVNIVIKNIFLTSFVASSLIVSSSFVSAMEADDRTTHSYAPKLPNFDQIVSGTYAVHLTQIYPENGLMIPGSLFSLRRASIDPKTKLASESKELLTLEQRLQLAKVTPKYRFTLHWSFSGIAEDHDFSVDGQTLNVARASHPFAILEPFEYLLPESYGGHDQAWMTVGPHKLSPKSILLAANSHKEQTTHFPGTVIYFDPETENLEQLLTQALKERKALVIKRDIPPSQYNVEVTLDNVQEMVSVDSPTLNRLFKPTDNIKEKTRKLTEKVNSSKDKKWIITRYNEDNVPLTVNESEHFNSPKEFYTSLRAQGYFWGKHEASLFGELEPDLKTLFFRTILFQAKNLFPEDMQDIQMIGFTPLAIKERLNENMLKFPIEYPKLAIKALNTGDFLNNKTKLSKPIQTAFKLWLKGLGIWIEYVCKKDDLESSQFLSKESDPSLHLNRVVATVNQHSTQPMIDLYK
jgi:hypothetical protein